MSADPFFIILDNHLGLPSGAGLCLKNLKSINAACFMGSVHICPNFLPGADALTDEILSRLGHPDRPFEDLFVGILLWTNHIKQPTAQSKVMGKSYGSCFCCA
jgi:hypothetical protein